MTPRPTRYEHLRNLYALERIDTEQLEGEVERLLETGTMDEEQPTAPPPKPTLVPLSGRPVSDFMEYGLRP
jgi:hypothetical protein